MRMATQADRVIQVLDGQLAAKSEVR
jgi:hypothetical protein